MGQNTTFLLLRGASESRLHEQHKPYLRFNYCGACHVVNILAFSCLGVPPVLVCLFAPSERVFAA
jgi:hypothetical protein